MARGANASESEPCDYPPRRGARLPLALILWLALLLSGAASGGPLYADSSKRPAVLLKQLERDMDDSRLDDFSLIQAAFILSGAATADSLKHYQAWYEEVLIRLRACHLDPFKRLESASTVFTYLHSFYLLEYKEEATTLLDVVRRQKYNCVAGTILYNLVCADLGWTTEAFETPTHVYTIFPNFTQTVTVENTSPMGFNIMRNLQSYSAFLLRYYPENHAAQIGLDRIYAYENSKGRRINNTELLGLLAYNRAYFALKQGDFAAAYEFVLLAQKFNRDSRSNIAFEQDLYYRWGKALHDAGLFDRAFSVYADGIYRYPEVTELAHNCRVAFFQALRQFGLALRWPDSRRLILEMADLDLLGPEDEDRLTQILAEWAEHFSRRKSRGELFECLDLLPSRNSGDARWEAMRRAAAEMPE